MVQITMTEGSNGKGKFLHNGISLHKSEDVSDVEITALWEEIRRDQFKKQSRALLADLCHQLGFDEAKLLADT
jgi:hypothetical protein